MLTFLGQNVGQNRNISVGNKSSVNVADFVLSGSALVNQNYMYKGTESCIVSGNAECHSIQNL
jgi:hypothetical protein